MFFQNSKAIDCLEAKIKNKNQNFPYNGVFIFFGGYVAGISTRDVRMFCRQFQDEEIGIFLVSVR